MISAGEIKMHIRQHYGGLVVQQDCCRSSSCCSPLESFATFIGASLGCGDPLSFAQVQPGETVVDLGSGAGREVLLAARQAGPLGRAIGIDMTPEMIRQARANAERSGIENAEFYLGEIEHLPLADSSVDVVISNCVINLVPDKARAFGEAYRVLRPGGRLVVSDVVSLGPLPEEIRVDPRAWAGCIAGAMEADEYNATIVAAGFREVETVTAGSARPGQVYSTTVRARKPSE